MSFIANDIELNQKLKGKVVASASSSLSMFAVKFADGSGLLIESAGTPDNPLAEAKIVPADELPSIGDAVCKVEWDWITESKIESVHTMTGSVKIILDPAGPLSILAQVWKGSLFLSFMPYKGSES